MKLALPMLCLMAAPLAAQSFELGVFVGKQAYKANDVVAFRSEPNDKAVAAARFGYGLVDVGPFLFQATLGYQPESNTEVKANGVVAGELKHSHTSLGAMFTLKAGVSFGAGMEVRREKLDAITMATTYTRPWVRANVGFAFPTPVVKPFLGLEVAVPMASKTWEATASSEDKLRAFAPKLQVGLYGGIRF